MAASIGTMLPVLKDYYGKGKAAEQLPTLKQSYSKSEKEQKKYMKKTMKKAEAKRAAAKRMSLAKTLKEQGGETFDSKVEFVKKHMPDITNPEAFVASALREAGEIE